MKKERIRKFAFFMAILMLFTSIDFTSIAAELSAEESMVSELQVDGDAMDEVTESQENEENEDVVTEDILPEFEWLTEETAETFDVSETVISENEEAPEADITNIAISEEDTIITTDYGIENPRKDASGNSVWDCVWFGNYWQNDTNGDGTADTSDNKEPIKWRVLLVYGDKALLLADKTLEGKPYNTSTMSVSWDNCTLRSWLNGYGSEYNIEAINYESDNFINEAFLPIEQSAIVNTTLKNSTEQIEGGKDTNDQLFPIFIDDILNEDYGFDSVKTVKDQARMSEVTAYAKGRVDTNSLPNYKGMCSWWLRAPGHGQSVPLAVTSAGAVGYSMYINNLRVGVRPALYLDLSSSSVWSYAGTVNAGGTVDEIEPVPGGEDDPLNYDVQFKITFDADGGYTTDGEYFRILRNGDTYGTLPEARKTNYRFLGWVDENGNTITASSIVSLRDNQILKAKYTTENIKQYTITLDADGGVLQQNTITVGEECTIGELPDPVKAGNTFLGWYYNDEKVLGCFVYRYGKDITLKAKYNEDPYYHGDKGGITSAILTERGGETVDVLNSVYTADHSQKTSFSIACIAAEETSNIDSFMLSSAGEVVASSKTGTFENLIASDFTSYHNVYLVLRFVIREPGTIPYAVTQRTQLGLNITNVEALSLLDGMKLTLGGDALTSIMMDEDIPVIGGQNFKFGFEAIPVSATIEDGKVQIGINLASGEIDNDGKFSGSNVIHDLKKETIKDKFKEYEKSLAKLETNAEKAFRYGETNVKDIKNLKDDMKADLPGVDAKFSISVAGYAMAEWSDNIDEISGELILVIKPFTYEQWWQTNIPVVVSVPVTINVSLGAELSVDGKLGYNFNRQEWYGSVDAEGKVTFRPYVGIGISDILSGGIYGEATVNLKARLLDMDMSNCGIKEAGLEASLGFTAYFAGIKTDDYELANLSILKNNAKYAPYIDGSKFLIYSSDKRSLIGDAIESLSSETGTYTTEQLMAAYYQDTEYLNEASEFVYLPASVFAGGANGVVATGVYQGALPQMIEANGKLYLFYLDLDVDRTVSANRSCLFYTVYDEETGAFINPVAVDDDNTADSNYSLATDGETVYVVYLDSNKTYEENEEVTLTDFASAFGISVAKVTENSAEELIHFEGENYPFLPKISVSENGVIIAWAENSENNIFGAAGTNTVKTAGFDGAAWSEASVVADGLKCITSMLITTDESGEGIVILTEDEDNDLAATPEQNLMRYQTDGTRLAKTNISVNGIRLVSVSENAYLLEDVTDMADANGNLLVGNVNGGLVCFDQELNSEAVTESGLIGTGNNFEIDNNKIYFLGSVGDSRNLCLAVKNKPSKKFVDENISENTLSSDINTDDYFSVTSLTKESDYVDEFTVAEGKAVYLLSEVDMSSYEDPDTENDIEMVSSLYLTEQLDTQELCLDHVYFDSKDIVPGQVLPMNVYLSNSGTEMVTYYELSLYPKGKEEEAVRYSKAVDIAPGKGVIESIDMPLPLDLSADTFVLKINSDNALEGEDTFEISLGKTDLAVDSEYRISESANVIRAVVGNISYFPATATVSVNDTDGKTIFTTKEEIGGLDYRFYDVELPADAIPAEGDCLYEIVVSCEEEEFDLDNNICQQRIWNFEVEETEIVEEPLDGYYVVSFNACGGKMVSGNAVSENEIVFADDYTNARKVVSVSENYGVLPAVQQENNEFLGWFTDPVSGNQITAETKVTLSKNQILYAHWKLLQYQVTFDANGGKIGESDTSVTVSSDGLTAVKTVVSNKPYGALPTVNREHYEFLGWFTTKEEAKESVAVSENALFTGSADQTLYAHWMLKTYTLTFDGCGGKLTTPDTSVQLSADGLNASKTVASGQEYGSFAIAAREGFLFAGWYTKPEGGELVTEKTVCSLTKDAVIYAQWNYITLVEKQKIEIKSFFEKEIQNYLGEDTKKKQYKYAVTKVATIAGNKGSASVSAKTGILTAKRSGVVEIRLMTKNLETKKWETSDKYLTVVIEKPVVKKVSMTYVGQQINVDEFLSYQGKEYYSNEPNYCDISYEITKPKAGKPEIAAVDVNGNLTAVSTGTTKLTITYKNNYGAQKPSVVKKTVSISVKIPKFSKETLTVAAGKTGSNALKNVSSKSQSVTYSVDKPWAEIDAKGKVKVLPEAASGETAKVTATVKEISGKEHTYSYQLKVK